jgi:hypothetical protein
MSLYLLANGPMQTTAAFASVTTGNTIKTMMQVVPKVSGARIIEWGISFDGSAAATPGKVELIETDAGATVTNYASADLTKLEPEALLAPSTPTTNLFDISAVTKSGYTSSGEGSITTLRNLDAPQFIAPSNQFIKQFPLGREPFIQLGSFARIRVTFGTAVNAYCYMIVQI